MRNTAVTHPSIFCRTAFCLSICIYFLCRYDVLQTDMTNSLIGLNYIAMVFIAGGLLFGILSSIRSMCCIFRYDLGRNSKSPHLGEVNCA